MVSCERPSPPNGEGVPRSLPEAGLHERGRALARAVRRGDRVHDEAAANGSLNGTTPKSDSRIVHQETCGNCRCCRSSIAHRLERGDACICSSTKGARYCQNEVAFLRSPRGGRPRRKVRRAQVRAGRCGRFLRKRKRWSGTSPTQRNRSHGADLNLLMERIRNRVGEPLFPGPICRSNSTNTSGSTKLAP
jgi:hypothetical protein